jgi:hypoxanthine phosphoribosyltransferase
VKDRPDVLFDEDRIRQRVAEVGVEVGRVFEGKELTMVALMKSCLLFMADLLRAVPLDVTCHFLRATTLREAGASPPLRTDIIYTAEVASIEGKDVLLLADVVDTGITLNFLLDHLREKRPATLKVATIIDKPGERKIDVHPDWALFTLTEPMERFLVGYGLDHNEFYRGLPHIGTIPRPAPAEGREASLTPGSMQ